MAASTFAFSGRRSVVHSTRGIVSCTNPLAAQAGIGILQQGGNAAVYHLSHIPSRLNDHSGLIAIATAVALGVLEPSMTGIGGDVFCLFYEAKTKKVTSLNGSGRSPVNSTLESVCKALNIADPTKTAIPRTSVHSVTIPGAAAAWVDVVEQFGSGKVSLEQVLEPSINLAEAGFPISEISANLWSQGEDQLKASEHGYELLKQDPTAAGGYRAPREGELVTNPLLASVLRQLAEQGKSGFYEGRVAKAIIEGTQKLGGFHSADDLRFHAEIGSEVAEPISIKLGHSVSSGAPPEQSSSSNSINGLELWEHAPNGQGIIALITLGLLQKLEATGKIPKLSTLDHNSHTYLHILIETLRIAFADASRFVADPLGTQEARLERLLTPEYLAERAELFNPHKAMYIVDPGSPAFQTGDTVYLAATDSEGNACSLVNSVADVFGSFIVPANTGFVLHSRASNFRLEPDHPNVYAPRKRPYNTIIPALVTNAEDGSLRSVYGVMGGFMQPQGHVQVLLNMAAFGMSPQAALDAPRICIGAPVPGKSLDPNNEIDMRVYVEEGVSNEVQRGLEALGHEVKLVSGYDRSLFGRGQVINVNHDPVTGQRVYSAGSDPRGDGAAVPL
ncbi:gamma-glutamyltranspeptidase [Xylariales sp. PMI_506]|nr:gamma-glutamyltranspeptidase [Xylariales sp. PMI_506]